MAKIKLNNNEYLISDSTLATPTADFIAHLGTVAGNGLKVVVNGVEYGVDSDKMSATITALETVFGNLSGGSNVPSDPEKNEYGFYYNVPYVVKFDWATTAFVFNRDAQAYTFTFQEEYHDFIRDEAPYSYTYDEVTNTATDEYGYVYEFSDDGCSFSVAGYTGIADTTIKPHPIHFGYKYISQNGDEVVLNKDGRITLTRNGISDTVAKNQWINEYRGYIGGTYLFVTSIDGETLYIKGYYETNQIIVYKYSGIEGSNDELDS